jgi:rhodanese-related sulfurtransferase
MGGSTIGLTEPQAMTGSFASTVLREAAGIVLAALAMAWIHTAVNPVPGHASAGGAPSGQPRLVDWREIEGLVASGAAVLVDADTATLFATGHIPGAESLPLSELPRREPAFRARHGLSATLIVYCADPSCPAAHAEALALSGTYGFRDVRELAGGHAAWRAEAAAGEEAPR